MAFTRFWHENIFGRAGNELLRGHLVNLDKAGSEAEFDSTIQSTRGILQNQVPCNGDLENELAGFSMHKHSYATYLIAEIPGNR